jgi:hypothetical protein
MKRNWVLASVCGAALLAVVGVVAFCHQTVTAQPNKAGANQNKQEEVQNLPITQVVLFSSGVGYFQREGKVEGNARIDMTFPVQDINDLIKSMVLRDLDNGHITAVSYDNNAPIDRTLKSFAINLTGNPSFSGILNQARGEKVEVVLTQTNATQPGTMTGTVVGIEHQRQAVANKDVVETEVLNLWCADGMRAIKLGDLQRIRFLNPSIDSEFKKALETLASSHDTQKKAVSIQCVGEGARRVKVGYVVENPIWKTSYRLVLDKAGEGEAKPYLQGWAVVENSTDEDWKDVRMALISGRPISFQMDLYSPLFVDRPTERLELFQSLRAVTYSGALERGEGLVKENQQAAQGKQDDARRLADRDGNGLFGARGPGAAPPGKPGMPGGGGGFGGEFKKDLNDKMNLGGSVASAASATKLGNFFQYLIEKPVQLARQKSALLPIVAKDVEGKRVSIYNERTHAKFPLLGMQLKNTSGAHLMQGPITVFEGSVYGGDAKIADLQPNEERLISYAVDLGTEVDAKPSSDNGRLTSVKAVKGVIYTTTKIREAKAYTIANRNDVERTLLVEHPVRNDFKLVDSAKPAETASDVYRFSVKVPAGKTVTETITEERNINSSVSISTQNDDQIRVFLSAPVTSTKVKKALEEAMSLRWETAKVTREIQEQERQLKIIVDDQARLRANLREMPTTAAAYKRYLEKFDTQETQIESYQAKIKELQTTEHVKKKAFEDFINTLDVE